LTQVKHTGPRDIDCLFVGHNEMNFLEYEKHIRHMGVHSGAYRDLNLNFIRYNNQPFSLSDIYNVLAQSDMEINSGEEPPLSIGENFSAAISYLGTYLQRRGFTFDFINAFQEQKDELAEKLKTGNILAVVIPTTLYVSAFPIIEIIDFIKTCNTGARIIVGGPFISTQIRSQDPAALKYLFNSTLEADFYVNSSQGEAALVNILYALKQGGPFHHINNIFYREGRNDEYVSTPVSKEINPLAENMVDWRLFARGVGKYANVRTSISCPFSCSFCGFPQRAGKYQTADVEAIEKELQELDKLKTVTCVHFIDDTFNVPLQRFKKILCMMIKNKFKFKWHSYFRCQFADLETVQLMKESGCEGVFLGLESGSDQILKNMNKNTDTSAYLKGIQLLKTAGIVVFGNFIMGFPGETHETVKDTINFIEKSQLDFYRTQLWYAEPITPIWQEKDRYKIEGESFEWSHRTMNTREACDIIDEIFLTRKYSIWVPQYNFDFDSFWHLVHRGIIVDRAGDFLRYFNNAVREKITSKEFPPKEVSYEIIKRLKTICQRETKPNHPGNPRENKGKTDANANLHVEFDF
jgi:anaerobic magnesium-protoporphyrin IX monomethyl ester cyclase